MENKSMLSVSDWVTFLSSEKQGAFAGTLGFAAVIIAMLALLITSDQSALSKAIGSLVIFGAYWAVTTILNREEHKAGKILENIMCGKYQNETQIQEDWLRGVNQKAASKLKRKNR